MEKIKENIEASKTVEDKWQIDQFLSRASIDMDQNYELFKELTNRGCVTFSKEDEEYEHVVDVAKKYRELEKFYEEINCYTYYLTHSIHGGVKQEWFDKNCEFGDECFYLDHLISKREELENGLINNNSNDNEDEDNNQLSTSEMEDKFNDAFDYFEEEILGSISFLLKKKGEEIWKKVQNLLSKKNEKEIKKEKITVLEQQELEQQLKAFAKEESEKIIEDIIYKIEDLKIDY